MRLPEKPLLLAILLASGALFSFVALAGAIFGGSTRHFDEFILLLFRNPANLSDPLGPPWLAETMRDFTALGSISVLLAIALSTAGFLFITGKRRSAWVLVWSITSGILISNLLKWFFHRPRPDIVPHIATVYTQSFPSGHAMLSAIVYLTLGALLARTQENRRAKLYLLAMAAMLTVVVGLSRIYLGVHWPTDVLGGWVIGSGWAVFCWLVMQWLQRRGKVEVPDDER